MWLAVITCVKSKDIILRPAFFPSKIFDDFIITCLGKFALFAETSLIRYSFANYRLFY